MKTIFGEHDEGTINQFHEAADKGVLSALMADGHKGYCLPIGGVVAYDGVVSPNGVGVDIACGNAAIKTDRHTEDFSAADIEVIACEIFDEFAFGAGGVNRSGYAPTDHHLFDDVKWEAIPEQYRRSLRDTARNQLGTIGGGNHYVDVFEDEEGCIWVGVHFGSRALGYKSANNFVAIAQGLQWGDRPNFSQEVLLDLNTPLGDAYWNAMLLSGEYAYAGREWVARRVVDILGAREVSLVHNHHNFAWLETHQGKDLIVVRKGATPAAPGQVGFVGGSMGDNSVILRGATSEAEDVISLQERALYSTVHGAGRVLSRSAAKKGKWLGTVDGVSHRDTSTIVTREAMDEWVRSKGVVLKGGGVDESPQAYRRLDDVLAAQGPTIEVMHTLNPIIVCMAP